MAIAPTEWLIVGAIIVLLFMFRPRAVTDLARSMGQVVAEFRKSSNSRPEPEKGGDLLTETAEKLGIRTEGKSPSQIREEILRRAGSHKK